jgi:hypothetical protein
MNERIYIKEELKETFRVLGCGIVDYIDVYKVHGNKYYFTAGNGKFHMTRDELLEHTLNKE